MSDDWDVALQEQAPREERQDDVTRPLPHALGPEKSLLSSMLQDPQEFIGVAIEEKLTPEHFYLPAHSTLFALLVELFESGQEVELVSLVQRLLNRGLLDRVGGPSAITDLYTYAPSPGHFRNHLQHVKDKFVLRSIIRQSTEAIAEAYEHPDDVAEMLDRREAEFLAIRAATDKTEANCTIGATVESVLDEMYARLRGDRDSLGLSTGFSGLDDLRCTLKPGEMFVIAARPSMGKTSLMMNIVEHLGITDERPGMVFSVEMTRKQLVERLVYARAKIAGSKFVPNYAPTKGELQNLRRASVEISGSKIIIDDTPSITINQLRAKARRKHREHKLEWIAIDYLQLIRSLSKQSQSSREREVSEISSGIKGLAKELNLPIILLAQLNRGPEGRTGKNLGRPRMSDLRESGSIEQDADVVGLLYREAYYADGEEEKQASAGCAELIIAKNRNGPTGSAHLTFIADIMRFEDGVPKQEPDMFQQPRNRFSD